MTDSPQAIEFESLTKDFPLPDRGRYLRAVDGLTLQIPAGTVFGLLGPNGSGKSTTIRMLLGLSAPTSGQAFLLGQRPEEGPARQRVGYLPDAPLYPKFLSGRELLLFFGKLLGLPKPKRRSQAATLLEEFGLADAMDRKLGSYSKGMLQRLGFAQALMGDPDVLVLDEPTAGVDPVGAAEVADFVRNLKARGKTVLLCSHLLTQVQDICDAVGIMNKGRLLASGRISDLLAPGRSDTLAVSGLDEANRLELSRLVAERGGQVQPVGPTLEDIFRSLVKSDDERKGEK